MVKEGPALFDQAAKALPDGRLKAAVGALEKGFLRNQHAMCTREADCHACCNSTFKTLNLDGCISVCDATGADKSPNSALTEAGKQLWGAFLIGMILYFVVSLLDSVVHQYLVREATRKTKAGRNGGTTDEPPQAQIDDATLVPSVPSAAPAADTVEPSLQMDADITRAIGLGLRARRSTPASSGAPASPARASTSTTRGGAGATTESRTLRSRSRSRSRRRSVSKSSSRARK